MMLIISVAGREEVKMRNWELDWEAERRRLLSLAGAPGKPGRESFAALAVRFTSLRDTMGRTAQAVGSLFRTPREPECC